MGDNREPLQGSDDLLRAARETPLSAHSPSEAMVRKARRSTEGLEEAEASASVEEDLVPVAAHRPEAPDAAITFSGPRRPPGSDSSGRVSSAPRPSPPRSREPLPGPARGEQRRRSPLRVLIPLLVVGFIVGTSLFDVAGDNATERPAVTTVLAVEPPPTASTESATIAPPTTSAPSGPGPEFTGPGEISVVGGAAVAGPVLRLTDANNRLQAAAAWLTAKQHVADGFTTTFRFHLTDVGANPGDGFAFVIQNSTGTALGDAAVASGIGYKGMRNSVAVEFDTTYHDYEQDPLGDHIAVHTHGTEPNTTHQGAMLAWVTPAGVRWQDQVHTVRIDYTPDTLSVFLDDLQNPVLEVGLNLSDTLRLDDGAAWVGFTASTEPGFTNRHDILEWSIESQPGG